MLLGQEGLDRLAHSTVVVAGAGGVGGYAAEMLVRAGIGHLVVIDSDTVSDTNRNRQILALTSTVGRSKCEVLAERLLDINPDMDLKTMQTYITASYHGDGTPFDEPGETSPQALLAGMDIDYVVDAIDTVSAKLHLAQTCYERGIPLISCMGMGNRLDPTLIRVGDIFETSGCPLCRVVRQGLRKRNIPSLRCVYSLEPAIGTGGRLPGSVSFVPPAAGLFLAAEAVRLIAGER